MGKPTEESAPARFPYPVGFGQLIGLTLRAFVRHLPTLAGLFGIPFLAIALLPVVVQIDFQGSAALTAGLVVLVVLPVVIGSIAAGIASVVIVDRLAGAKTTVRSALLKLRGRLDRVVIASGLATFLTIVLATFMNWLYVLMLMSLFMGPPIVVQIITIESLGFREGLRRALELVAGQRLRVFMYLFNTTLMSGVIAMMGFISIAQAVVGNRDLSDLDSSTSYLIESARGVLFGLCAALVTCAATIIYLALRAEKEGLAHDELVELRTADPQS